MKAITVVPGQPATLELSERDEPDGDELLVEALAIGICGTDREIIHGGHGEPPPGSDRLIIGHESLGRVVEAPPGSGFSPGDLVAGIVRRPDPEPCPCCAAGHWDMCLNGNYLERGIKQRDGYAAERYRLEPGFAVAVPRALGERGVLVEPTSVVAKAWRRVRSFADLNCRPVTSVLITGAGPIGLLAALLGREFGFDVHVLDRVTEGPKPKLVGRLGGAYYSSLEDCPATDVVIECTGAGGLIAQIIAETKRNSVVCLTGVSEPRVEEVDVGVLNRELVLENDIVLGSVNASRDDYVSAVRTLAGADQRWLGDVITRRVPLAHWREAYEQRPDDVKVVVDF